MQGSMATTALIAASPFNSFAKIAAPLTGFNNNKNGVVFLHTSSGSTPTRPDHITTIKDKFSNVLLMHAGPAVPAHLQPLKYDVSMQNPGEVLTTRNYTIVYKGAIKTGVINIYSASTGAMKEANELAAYLKTEKNCDLVVCLSALGYKTNNDLDDRRLANLSSHIDMIIGGHESNFSSTTMIALNRNNAEVIIDHSANATDQLGKVSINFNRLGIKSNIDI